MLSAQKASEEPLLVSRPSDIHGSVLSDTIVQRNCFLHVRGNLLGSLTIEPGAQVVVEGSVDGRIVNRGGTLVVNNKGLAACVMTDGPPEAEACAILKINLSALAQNWEALSKRTDVECAAVLSGNAYGLGIESIAGALAQTGCATFFVSDLSEARRVRAIAPDATIYVLSGFYSGTGPAFAEINARPVINSLIQMAEWDAFVAGKQWTGGCALNVDTGDLRRGLSTDEAVAFASRVQSPDHGIALLMSTLDHGEKPDLAMNERQVNAFRDLRRLYSGVPASLSGSSCLFREPKTQFDLVRLGAALYGANPAPGRTNPMLSVLELRARIVQLRNLAAGEVIADNAAWTAKRRMKIAVVSVGYADGYPRPISPNVNRLQVIVGGARCPVAGPPSMDLLPVDVTDLTNPTAARRGAMVTLIGPEFGISDLAAAAAATGREVLSHFGQRFHRIYYAT
jgi:alanine racemase